LRLADMNRRDGARRRKTLEKFARLPFLHTAIAIFTAAPGVTSVSAATVVALGASNTYGNGVSRQQAYPARLEALLRARGLQVRVVNASVNGDTTGGMLRPLDRVPSKDTVVVILQPGGNDRRKLMADERETNISAMCSRLSGRGIRMIMLENQMLPGLPHQPDGMHLTPEGYHMLAEALVSEVSRAIGK
jgi:acyl-CoA thioesterase-1